MKNVNLLKDKSGTSMIFAIVLFLVMTVFGVNLLNAVNANILDTSKEIQKEQSLLYITSVYDVINQMVCAGEFLDTSGSMPASAETEFKTKDETIKVKLVFTQKATRLQTNMNIEYKGGIYKIQNYYTKTGALYKLERCSGLEGA